LRSKNILNLSYTPVVNSARVKTSSHSSSNWPCDIISISCCICSQ